MDGALRSRRAPLRATAARMILVSLAAIAPARADEPGETPEAPRFVIVPRECAGFWRIADGAPPAATWDAVLSFAACIQDASVYRIDRVEQLERFVEGLRAGLDPSVGFYLAAIEQAPGPTKLRAAYFVALGRVALITRARASIRSPALRQPLEALLEPDARAAYLLFVTISRAAVDEPELAPDAVSRYMVRSARQLAAALRRSWPMPADDFTPLFAFPR